MQTIVMCSNFIKIFITMLLIYFVYIKIINYKNNSLSKTISALTCSMVLAIMYAYFNGYLYSLIFALTLYIIYELILHNFIIKDKNYHNIIAYVISCVIAYAIYLVSIVISGVLLSTFMVKISFRTPISLITIPLFSFMIGKKFLTIKRFENGFNFLKNTSVSKNIVILIIFCIGVILLVFGLSKRDNSIILDTGLFMGSILMSISISIGLQSQITKHYKKNMRDRTISVQKAEIDEQTKLLEEVKAENLKLATAVHKYNHRLSSLELAMKSAISHNLNTEFADELSVMLKDTEDLSNSFANECNVAKCILPLTNVPSIDNMFKYMQDEASKCNINFDLKVNESINDLIDNIIPKDMFETLLGDHLRDAIIAVNASDNSYKSILTTLGLVDGCYELSIYDTGIEFQIDTLLKLSKEQVTTHKDSGGSGIGFITTFETLKTTKASLVIEEYSPETTNYIKSVNIRFDGKNQYRIYSYRADDIKKQNKEKRIIIKNIE